jgi:putative tricarboxylic transport membrane protein
VLRAIEMRDNEGTDDSRPLVTTRTVDAVVALLLLAVCAVVILDSTRLGFNWREGEGPAPGYFPFYIAVILGIASLINLFGALRGRGAGEIFVSMRPFGRVLAVLIPTIVYVALIGGVAIGPVVMPGLGIYVSSAIFISLFMMVIGRENPFKAIAVGVGVPLILFMMFEKWFLVPLPKGPLEAWLGY